jgi:hypothetical protein
MRIIIIIFLLVFTLIGLYLVWYGISSYRQSQASLSWPAVAGKVTTSKVIIEEDADLDECYIGDIEYLYVVGNKEYRNKDVVIGPSDCSESVANEIVKKYPAQAEVKVFYDPNQPEVSALEPGANNSSIIFIVLGLIWTAITSLLLLITLKGSLKQGLVK